MSELELACCALSARASGAALLYTQAAALPGPASRTPSRQTRARCARWAQVEGKAGFAALLAKVRASGPSVLWHGAIAASVATFVGHYPW